MLNSAKSEKTKGKDSGQILTGNHQKVASSLNCDLTLHPRKDHP